MAAPSVSDMDPQRPSASADLCVAVPASSTTTMLYDRSDSGGIVVAPHRAAAQSGAGVLSDGGTAIEAMVAMAATIAVVYPHMTGLGGDGFWLIHGPEAPPIGIDACGPTGAAVTPTLYRGREALPARGPLAANTVAGTVSGWAEALEHNLTWGGRLPLDRLLADAIAHADRGIAVTESQARLTAEKLAELRDVPGFAEAMLAAGARPREDAVLRQPALARTLRRLASDGLDGFYRGALAHTIAADLARAGAPVTGEDLAAYRARRVVPVEIDHSVGTLFNLPPPTQGLASLMVLGVFDRLGVAEAESFAHVHGLVEATKLAFKERDRLVTDPDHVSDLASAVDAALAPVALDRAAAAIDPARARPWPARPGAGDTVWLGAIDAAGRAVSFIQSLYWEFGSGVVLQDAGLVWQNRGSSFTLGSDGVNPLQPGRRPFHTLNPALARFADGRTMVYGAMGGDGQPQSQAAVFTRYAMFGRDLASAVAAPRWLLGRTWGDASTSLKLEARFDPALIQALEEAGHAVERVAPVSDLMGHAGAVVRHPSGVVEGAADPRSDGAAIAAPSQPS